MKSRKRSNSFITPAEEVTFIRKPIPGLGYLVSIAEHGGPQGINLCRLRIELIFENGESADDFRRQLYLLYSSYTELCIPFSQTSQITHIAEFANRRNIVHLYLPPAYNHLSEQTRCDMIEHRLHQMFDLSTIGTMFWISSQQRAVDRIDYKPALRM